MLAVREVLVTWLRVTAPHFVAGIRFEDGVAREAAPVLRWALGKTETWFRDYAARKGWSCG